VPGDDASHEAAREDEDGRVKDEPAPQPPAAAGRTGCAAAHIPPAIDVVVVVAAAASGAILDQGAGRPGCPGCLPLLLRAREQHEGRPAKADVSDEGDELPDKPPGRAGPPVRAVASQHLFLDKNRRHIGKSQSKRPPNRTQRPPHASWQLEAGIRLTQ
jgi:hypothetical protein